MLGSSGSPRGPPISQRDPLLPHVRRFAALMTKRRGLNLQRWMTSATTGEPVILPMASIGTRKS